MASNPPPRRGPSRDRKKSLQKAQEGETDEATENHKPMARALGKKVQEGQKKAPSPKRIERPMTEPKIENFFEDVANNFENRGPTPQPPSSLPQVPVDQIGVVPIRESGKRMLKYLYNGHTRWVELPPPKYGNSLGDILPPEIHREPWMELVRHPLTWDGVERKWMTVGPTQLVFEHIPKKITPCWKTSVESVGMHWFEDYPVTERPPYQMSLLFRIAILGSPYQTLGSYDIVEILMAKFPWYNANRYRERSSTSAIQRSRDLNSYWVDQISNMSSKSTNRNWLDKHPFLARMTRGAKGHFWRLQDVPAYRIPPGKLPVYAVLSLPPGVVLPPPAAAPALDEKKEKERVKIWDRDSRSPSIDDSVEMLEVQEPASRPAIRKTYVVEQNSSGEDEAPDEDDEMSSQPPVPFYAAYRGMLSVPQNYLGNPENPTGVGSVGYEPAAPSVVSTSWEVMPKMEEVEDSRGAENTHHSSDVGFKSQREDLLMELVEFALEMDARKPAKPGSNPLVRCSSATPIPQATPEPDRSTRRRAHSTTDQRTPSIEWT